MSSVSWPVDARSTLIDDTSTPNMTYVGYADTGSATSAAVWQVKRVDESGAVVTVLFAGAGAEFNQIWDDRVSLDYA